MSDYIYVVVYLRGPFSKYDFNTNFEIV